MMCGNIPQVAKRNWCKAGPVPQNVLPSRLNMVCTDGCLLTHYESWEPKRYLKTSPSDFPICKVGCGDEPSQFRKVPTKWHVIMLFNFFFALKTFCWHLTLHDLGVPMPPLCRSRVPSEKQPAQRSPKAKGKAKAQPKRTANRGASGK